MVEWSSCSASKLFCHHNLVGCCISEAAVFTLHVPPSLLLEENDQDCGTSGSIGGYFLPLLFPKHFVFPPSRSWHQKPFWGSNLSENKVNYIQFMNLLEHKTVIFLPLSRPQYPLLQITFSTACDSLSSEWRKKTTLHINVVNTCILPRLLYMQVYLGKYMYVHVTLYCRGIWTGTKRHWLLTVIWQRNQFCGFDWNANIVLHLHVSVGE